MDYQTLIEQLPELYENWGQDSVYPKSDQFQKVLDKIQGMTTANVMQLLNFAVEFLEPGEIYLEVGCCQGATLIGVLLNHPELVAYGVGNFVEWDFDGNLQKFYKNLNLFAIEIRVIFYNQLFEDLFLELREVDLEDKIGIYFYNSSSDYRSQLLSLTLVEPFLADKAVIIIASTDEATSQAILDFMATHRHCKLFCNLGVYILVWDVNKVHNYEADFFISRRNHLLIQSIKGVMDWKVIEKIGVGWQLPSGLIVKVQSPGEWVIYHEVFIEKEYDLPINKALEDAPTNRPLRVLDLGANVGFFTLRVADLIIQSSRENIPVEITLVEGSPNVYKKLEYRLSEIQSILSSKLEIKLKIVNGLIGELQGTGKIFEADFQGKSSIYYEGESQSNVCDVPYIDLFSLKLDEEEIDLLKCDIEGAELRFLENYKTLLYRVKYAVFEFHPDKCDSERCFNILKEVGLTNHKTLWEGPTNLVHPTSSVHLFWK